MAALPPSVAVKLAKASADIRQTPKPAASDLAFMARQLVLATLPHYGASIWVRSARQSE